MRIILCCLLYFIWSGLASSQIPTDCWANYNTSNCPISSNVVQSVDIGSSDTLWIGTINGLVKYDNASSWTTYNTSNSNLPNDGVYAIALDQVGKKWIGTWGGGVGVFEGGGTWTIYNTSNSGLPHNFVNVITIDPIGVNWIGTLGGGLAIYDGATWNTFNVSNSGLPGDFIWCVSVSPDGNKWIGTSSGLGEYDGTNWTTYNSTNSGIPHPYNIIRSVDFDSQNNKWIGTQGGGLVKFDGVSWTIFNTGNSNLPDNDVINIVVDSQDRVWVATDGGGIAFLESGNFTVFHTSNSGLPYDQIANIFIDGQDNYWISTGGNGLSQLHFQNLSNLPDLSLETEPPEKYFCDSVVIMADTGLSNYIWSNGGTSSENVVFSSGTYWVYNQDTNGCVLARDSITLIHDNFPPYNEEICLATIDSATNKNAVVFNKTPGKGIDYYKIFEFNNLLGQYDSIGSVDADSPAVFIDDNANPNEQSKRYKITAVNICTGESTKSEAHETIFLNSLEGPSGEVCLFWTNYDGFSFSSYDVYMGSSPDSLTYFGSTSDTVFTCLNPPPELTFYQVRIKSPSSCVISPQAFYADTRSNITDNDFTGFNGPDHNNPVQVFPNPFDGSIKIHIKPIATYRVIIIDAYGKKVDEHRHLIGPQELRVKQLSKGLYYLEVFQKGQLVHKEKILKY